MKSSIWWGCAPLNAYSGCSSLTTIGAAVQPLMRARVSTRSSMGASSYSRPPLSKAALTRLHCGQKSFVYTVTVIVYTPFMLCLERGLAGLEGLLRLPGLPCLLLLCAVNIRESVNRFRRLENIDLEHGALLAVLCLVFALL